MVSVRNCHLARSPFAIYYRDYSVDHEKIPRSNIVSSWPTCCYKLEIFDALRSGIFVVHMSYAFHWQVFVSVSCGCRRNKAAVASPVQRTNHHNLVLTMQLSWTQVKSLYATASIGGNYGELPAYVRVSCIERD